MFVRKYSLEDKKDVQFVCLNSEGNEVTGNLGEFVLHTFCDYYLEHEPYNCFVLDDNGKAVGYIICTEDYDNYKKIFDSEYMPLNEPLGDDLYKWGTESTVLQNKYKADYPAHLHIDILPEYHRQGWGGKLLSALFEHLRSKGVKGVMLTAGAGNVNAGNFYKKYGFETLEIMGDDVAFAMKLL